MDFLKSILVVFFASMNICCFGQDCLLMDEIEGQKPIEEDKCYEYTYVSNLYEIITEQVLAPPPPEEWMMAEVMTKTTRRLVKEAHCDWVEVVCEDKETPELFYQIKDNLKRRFYYVDYPLNSFKTKKMMEDLTLIQKHCECGLPIGNLNIKTLRALGIDYKAL